jgi:peptidoglycan/LPS O-acetylase OafA/YrhL
VSATTAPLIAPPFAAAVRAAGYRPLGGLRFGLAILVVVQHFQHLLVPQDQAVFGSLGLGLVAVAVFFAISGFVVTEAITVFYADRPLAFMQNRLLRLVPPYAAALVLSVALHVLLWHLGRLALWDYGASGAPLTWPRLVAGFAGLLPGLQALRPGDSFEFIPYAWSLRVEMAFYVVTALVVMAAGWSARRAILNFRTAIGVSLLAALGVSVWFQHLHRPGLLSCAPMFLAGIALCLVLTRRGVLRCLFLAMVLPAAWLGFASWRQHGHPMLPMQFLAVGLLFAIFALLAGQPAGRWQRLDRRLGDLSYPLYLNHYVVGIAVTDLCPVRNVAVYLASIGASVLLAAMMGGVVDGRLTGLRRRVRLAGV